MDKQTGIAHLRLLGFKNSDTWGATHMEHSNKVIVYFDHIDQKWAESNMSFGPIPTEILRILNHE